MAQVERYVRLSVSGLLHEDDEYIVGLAFEPGESLRCLRQRLQELVYEATSAALSDENRYTGLAAVYKSEYYPELDVPISEALHLAIEEYWPGRAHFIEVQHDSDDGWVQIFQPYDLPVREELVPKYMGAKHYGAPSA